MSIDVTVRHFELSEKLCASTREKSQKLQSEFPAIESVRTVWDMDGAFYLLATEVQGKGCDVAACSRGTDAVAALNEDFDKVRLQLRKLADKRAAR